MKLNISRETVGTALDHLKTYAVRYAISTTIVGVLGLAASKITPIADGMGLVVNLISMFI